MPLLDHFHPPLKGDTKWESFHTQWASSIAAFLNQHKLSERFRAEVRVNLGGQIEVDVATLERDHSRRRHTASANGGATAIVESPPYSPPEPAAVLPATFIDEFEVLVLDHLGGPTLVAAIELVSPANKDRPESRQAFASKCASYLAQGIGLVIVDAVTERHANLHDVMIDMLTLPPQFHFPHGSLLYVSAYRPARRVTLGDQIDVWYWPLAIGSELPTVPLALRNSGCVDVNLELAYLDAYSRSRLP